MRRLIEGILRVSTGSTGLRASAATAPGRGSDDFRGSNFGPLQNQTLGDPNYGKTSHVDMTRDGFTFLVMGFTGKDAAAWKEKYIAAFNAMEAELREPAPF
jgi:Rha family phage regulatory protein